MKRLIYLIPLIFFSTFSTGQEKPREKPLVLHLHVNDVIDPRTNRYTELGLQHAKNIAADYIILELDTYGGALTDADDIRTRILDLDIPIYAFINKDAASAGALISIACDSIYMAPGSSIGAATVVTGDGTAAPDKYQSYMRSIMRSTAEAKGRDPRIAEGMVDQDINIDSIATEGKVITFSTSEAIKWGFCEAQVNSIDDIMKRSGVSEYTLEKFTTSGTEKIIRFFLNPVVSGLLIMIIIGGIWFELQTPGVGFPIAAAVVAAILYFIPHYLNGLAANWEILMFVIGVILILVELFVIPGFGVAGILGITFTIGSLVLIMVNNDVFDFSFVNTGDMFQAVVTTLVAVLGAFVMFFVLGIKLTDTNFFTRVALVETQNKEAGFTSKPTHDMIGKHGKSYTVLRPSGKVMIDDVVYDAYTRGNYIAANVDIEVISDEGTSLKVKEIR
jgi:membrane-bound serine protease (ClpP class)